MVTKTRKKAMRAKPKRRQRTRISALSDAQMLKELEARVALHVTRSLADSAFAFGPRDPEPPFQWTTADGDFIEPKDMEEGHLRNAISYVVRRLPDLIAHAVWLNPIDKDWVRPERKKTASVRYYCQALFEFLKEAERREIAV